MTRRKLLASVAGIGLIGVTGLGVKQAVAGNSYYDGPQSGHFDGKEFFNPNGIEPKGFSDLLKWKMNGEKAKWPDQWPSPFPQVKPDAIVEGTRLVVTHIGHASVLYQTAGQNILIDPVWSERTSPVSFAGPKRVNVPGVDLLDLPKIDVIIVTHNHYDHLEIATLRRLVVGHDPLIITPLGNDAVIKTHIPNARFAVLDWHESVSLGALTFHAEPCHHWSARGTSDRRHALWASFVITGSGAPIFHIGDTGFDSGKPYQTIFDTYGPVRFACLPIGAYAPRWFMAAQHQDPMEALQGFQILQASYGAGHHWGTVQLTDEAIEEPRDLLHAALDQAAIVKERFPALQPGMVLDIPFGMPA